MLQVFSHPRSGTHLLMAFVAGNFYRGKDLSLRPLEWGHWSDRQKDEEGNSFGRLFGNHKFPNWRQRVNLRPKIYIYRDGRAVAYSLWNSPGFLHPDMHRQSFSDFLRTPLDWKGSPNKEARTGWTVAEHWYRHVRAWHRAYVPRLLRIRYEDLVLHPGSVHRMIRQKLYPFHRLQDFQSGPEGRVRTVEKQVGLQPNEGSIDAWKEAFTPGDEAFFLSCLPDRKYLFE